MIASKRDIDFVAPQYPIMRFAGDEQQSGLKPLRRLARSHEIPTARIGPVPGLGGKRKTAL